MNKAIVGVVGMLFLAGCASARPAQNVDPARHPNLAEAQRLSAEAFDRIQAAQRVNEFDLGGHAQKAKDLLIRVNDELKQAALASNTTGR